MATVSVASPALSPSSEGRAELVAAVRAGEDWARAALYDRHAPEIGRVLHAVLGPDHELPDLIQETFIEVFDGIGSLRDPEALAGWMRQVAVNIARSCIRKRRRMRWLHVFGLTDVAEPAAIVAPPEARQAIAEIYRVLGELPVDLRLAFSLRHIEGLELSPGDLRASAPRRLHACFVVCRRLCSSERTALP